MKPEQIESDRLRKDIACLKAERDTLKKGLPHTLQGARYEACFPRITLSQLVGGSIVHGAGRLALRLPRLGHRQPSQRTRDDGAILRKVHASFVASDRTYGARRIWRDVLAEGVLCGLHRIEGSCASMPNGHGSNDGGCGRTKVSGHCLSPKFLEMQFTTDAPNQKRITDFKHIEPPNAGFTSPP